MRGEPTLLARFSSIGLGHQVAKPKQMNQISFLNHQRQFVQHHKVSFLLEGNWTQTANNDIESLIAFPNCK